MHWMFPRSDGAGTRMATIKIGDLLVQRGLITSEQLDQALVAQRRSGVRLGVCLVNLGYITERSLALTLSEQLNIPQASPGSLDDIPPEVIERVPRPVAEAHRIIPMRVLGGREVEVCLADPQNLNRLDDIAFALGCKIKPYLATELAIDRALSRYYSDTADTWDDALSASGEWRAFREDTRAGTGAGQRKTLPLAEANPADKPAEVNAERWVLNESGNNFGDGAAAVAAAAVGESAVAEDGAAAAAAPLAVAVAVATVPVPAAYERLASVTSGEDLVTAVSGFLGEIFPANCVLDFAPDGVRCAALWEKGARAPSFPPPAKRIPVHEATWVKELLRKPRIVVVEQVFDLHLRVVLEHVGVRPAQLSLIPVFDYGRLRYVLVGQGLPGSQVKQYGRRIAPYIGGISSALRMVALREHILERGRRSVTGDGDGGNGNGNGNGKGAAA